MHDTALLIGPEPIAGHLVSCYKRALRRTSGHRGGGLRVMLPKEPFARQSAKPCRAKHCQPDPPPMLPGAASCRDYYNETIWVASGARASWRNTPPVARIALVRPAEDATSSYLRT